VIIPRTPADVSTTDGAPEPTGTIRSVDRSQARPSSARAQTRLTFFLPWLFRLALSLGITELLAGIALRVPVFLSAAALTTAFAIAVLFARYYVDRGRAQEATWTIAVALCVAGFLGTLIVPGVDEAMSLLPILAVALLLPYARRTALKAVVALAAGSTALILIGAAVGSPAPLPDQIADIFPRVVLIIIVGLIMAALVDFWNNAIRSREAFEASDTRERAQSAERIALGRVLESLRPGTSVEATADAIARALVTLPGINIGGVLEFHDGGLRILAVVAPPGYPLRSGDQFPEAQGQGLIASSTGGPWAEPTRPASGPTQADAGETIGLIASVWAPMRTGSDLVGLIGIGTSEPGVARHLIEDLPAVGEVAATALALLGPALLARRRAADARGLIEAIIAERAFMPVFQAISTLDDREVVAYEALTRFTDGVRPDRHFANAVAVGLGVDLELVTLESAVRAAERIPYDLWLSLNVSPLAVEAGSRLSRILRLSHHPLILELTEHVAVADYTRLRAALKELRVPFRIAVDDAGAGYASMTHVVELEPSLVKLDISLVRGIDADPVRQALIAGMLFFSERTDCRLLAEGIETEAELATLIKIGVPLGQGYLLGRPGEFVGRPPDARPTPRKRHLVGALPKG
jgi:EAL domain-containing protein (putative c-di-GMP-specific phosphodiesterase class I)